MNTFANVAYAYRIPFNKDKTHGLSIGVQAGIIANKLNISEAIATHDISMDPALLGNNAKSVGFDLNVGINYFFKGLNVGFSVPQVIGGKLKFRENGDQTDKNSIFQTRREYIVLVSYEARFGGKDKKTWMITPSVMMRKYEAIDPQLDFNLMLGYKKLIWLGGGYRTGGSINGIISPNAAGFHATAGAGIKERVNLFYTMELPFKNVRNNFGYTHEVTIQCNLTRKVDKKDYEKDKKKMEDDIANVDKKADSVASVANDALDKSNTAMDKTQQNAEKLDKVEQKANEAFDKASTATNTVDKLEQRVDNIMFKKLTSVYFDHDQNALTHEAKDILDALKVKLSEMQGNYFIYLAGNASQEGDINYNQALSAKRCDAVKQYLEGITLSERILLLPYGENSTVTNSQSTEAERAKNRRVDIFISGQ
ncbi:MAG: PorP/SprF family type IX secretion system membrane protein [Sphingobacteriales bacterium]|nr:MAG: PorP/SprF family type IX secretion system membrane protein [Sphingobacteriales bacterium]